MSEANKTQVAGNHYRQPEGIPQHWDLAIMYGWDFFQYQITKYVMRWKDKHPTPERKLEDLKKARHFLDKYIENYERFLDITEVLSEAPPPYAYTGHQTEDQAPNESWTNEGYYGDGTALFKCRSCGHTTRQPARPPLPHACNAGAALDPRQQPR